MKFVETIKTHILYSTNFSPKVMPFIKMWENMAESGKSQMAT